VLAVLAALPGSRASAQDPYQGLFNNAANSYWGYWRPQSAVADIIDAQGRYLISEQQASMMREKVRQEKLATHKAVLEHWYWQRAFLQKAEAEQNKREREMILDRAIDNASNTEILSGSTLNTLLKELSKADPNSLNARLNPDWLDSVHMGCATDHGLGILSKKSIFWPPLLAVPEFADARNRITTLITRMKEGVTSTQGVNQEIVLELRREIKNLRDRLLKGIREGHEGDVLWTDANCMTAKNVLKKIDDAAKTAGDNPNAGFYLQRPKVATVGELVAYMTERGLTFTEAMLGDERHYIGLQKAMAGEAAKVRPAPAAQQ
jgi:hypothetical protein